MMRKEEKRRELDFNMGLDVPNWAPPKQDVGRAVARAIKNNADPEECKCALLSLSVSLSDFSLEFAVVWSSHLLHWPVVGSDRWVSGCVRLYSCCYI